MRLGWRQRAILRAAPAAGDPFARLRAKTTNFYRSAQALAERGLLEYRDGLHRRTELGDQVAAELDIQTPNEDPPMSKTLTTVRIENTTRSVWRFPIYNDKRTDPVDRVVLGDCADAERCVEGEPGSPVQLVKRETFEKLREQHGDTLRAMARNGDIVITGATL